MLILCLWRFLPRSGNLPVHTYAVLAVSLLNHQCVSSGWATKIIPTLLSEENFHWNLGKIIEVAVHRKITQFLLISVSRLLCNANRCWVLADMFWDWVVFCLLSIKRETFKSYCEFCTEVLIRKHNSTIVLNQKNRNLKLHRIKHKLSKKCLVFQLINTLSLLDSIF